LQEKANDESRVKNVVVRESVRHTAKGRAGPLEDDHDDEVIVAKPIA
jgi:hypothetical protein